MSRYGARTVREAVRRATEAGDWPWHAYLTLALAPIHFRNATCDARDFQRMRAVAEWRADLIATRRHAAFSR